MNKRLKEIIAQHKPGGKWEQGWNMERCRREFEAEKVIPKQIPVKTEYIPERNVLLNVRTAQDAARLAGIDPKYLDEWECRTRKQIQKEMEVQYIKKLDRRESECCITTMIIVLDAIRRYMEYYKLNACGWKRIATGIIEDGFLNEASDECGNMRPPEFLRAFIDKVGKDKDGNDRLQFEFDEPYCNDILDITATVTQYDDEFYKLPPRVLYESAFHDGEHLSNIVNTVGMIDAYFDLQDHLNSITDEFLDKPITKLSRASFKKRMSRIVAEFNFSDAVNSHINEINAGNGKLLQTLDKLKTERGFCIADDEYELVRRWGW